MCEGVHDCARACVHVCVGVRALCILFMAICVITMHMPYLLSTPLLPPVCATNHMFSFNKL